MRAEIKLHLGDITKLEVDAIVNAANSRLMAGGGVCGAIFKTAGIDLDKKCRQIGYCETGKAVISEGFNLKAKFVIHAVGPIYDDDPYGAPALLASCYRESLALAHMHDLNSIAFPCISTGIYGYPKEEAAKIAVYTVRGLSNEFSTIKEIIFCCFEESDYFIYKKFIGNNPS